ncbi:MAG: SRPBCC family protein [Myxococcota bacterium]
MKKVVAVVFVLAVMGAAALVGVISMQPAQLTVERSIVVDATPADVAPWISDLENVDAWSPWNARDPGMTKTSSEVTDQVGSWHAWDGNDEVGAGRQTIVRITDPEGGDFEVEQALHFDRPFESDAKVLTSLHAMEEGTQVTWSMTTENDFFSKAFGLLVDMDAMLGADFEQGLAMLKPLAEASRAEREEAEEAAEAEEHEEEARLAAEEAERLHNTGMGIR